MHKRPELNILIHENLWIVISFAFGQPVIYRLVESQFKGEWKYLGDAIYGRAEVRADRALLEMATQLRALDDAEQINGQLIESKFPPLGTVTQGNGTVTDLYFRDFTNKVTHAERFDWDLASPDNPKVICFSYNPERWQRAEISIPALMALIGGIMH